MPMQPSRSDPPPKAVPVDIDNTFCLYSLVGSGNADTGPASAASLPVILIGIVDLVT